MDLEMDAKEIRDRIVIGSRNIDQMKADLRILIGNLRTLLIMGNPVCPRAFRQDFEISVGVITCEWMIYRRDSDDRPHFSCTLRYASGSEHVYSTQNKNDNIPGDYVQILYESTPGLIRGLYKEFPGISERWTHLIDASRVFE
jgi:hypothetical protein